MSTRDWLLDDSPATLLQANLGRAWRMMTALLRNPLAVAGLLIILLLLATALFAPWIAPESPVGQNLQARLLPPSAEHWMGTDELGRDIFSRVVYGSRITLMIVALVAVISAPLGLIIGAVAGYFGGWVDRILMGLTDVFLSLPKLILALAFVAALGPGIENAIIAIAITAWPAYARIARAETLTFRNAEYIQAVRLVGGSHSRIIFRHVLPLCTSSMIVRVTLDMAGIILTAAGLGFLGLGAQPPLPEWGAMISRGRTFILDQWWVATMPGFAIILVSLGFCFLGDGLRDVLDPKQGGEK
ncbi:nickel transporter permease [Oceanicola sp. S124]|uniref:nickel transporter permease n=1 Tax=Oceanicola sp. S124 TaxID=1042378 RepID=UPI0002558172|nr:nickel transporter permease [Oceanicola sp. S124]